MEPKSISISTSGERFYAISKEIEKAMSETWKSSTSGVLTLFIQHTSCALTINESFDPSAARDMESFLKHLAPRNLGFIEHDAEGPDDSPSHMKSILLQTSLQIPVDQGKMMLGTWQGIYLCEFRDSPKTRRVILKYQAD
ncbi:MAG: YjbQ family protein [Oligoflexia bacterium]|nr:YjbQ family protein [Oligoflexia bacterium]